MIQSLCIRMTSGLDQFKISGLLIAFSIFFLLLSFLGFAVPTINILCFLGIILLVFFGSLVKLEFGVLAIIFELGLGGHGYLFSFPIGSFSLSLRIGLFIAVIVAWAIFLFKEKKLPRIFHLSLRYPFFFFAVLCLIGLVIGFFNNNASLVFYDGNAYFALLYIPMFIEVFTTKISLRRMISTIVSVGAGLAIATILLLGIYATFHYDDTLRGASQVDQSTLDELAQKETEIDGAPIGQRISKTSDMLLLDPLELTKTKPATYRWLRDTGTAEISYISGRFFRVFFPSHILMVMSFFISLAVVFLAPMRKKTFIALLIIFILALYISFSRSLWLGSFGGILCMLFFAFARSSKKKKFMLWIFGILIGLAILFAITGSLSIFSNRIQSIVNPGQDVAGTHRIELIKAIWKQWKANPMIGSGFGTLVSFPTVLPNGQVTPVSFYVYEWAYGDIAVKTGAIGLFGLLWLLGLGVYRLSKLLHRKYFSSVQLGLLCAFLSLIISNITTPVFTHPLGLGFMGIIFAFCFFPFYANSSTNSNLE